MVFGLAIAIPLFRIKEGPLVQRKRKITVFEWSPIQVLTLENLEKFNKMSTTPCIPRRSPIQVLTWLNVA